jgi:hypothetical protein
MFPNRHTERTMLGAMRVRRLNVAGQRFLYWVKMVVFPLCRERKELGEGRGSRRERILPASVTGGIEARNRQSSL